MTDEQSPSQPQDAGPQPIPPAGGPDMDLGGYLSAAWSLVTGDFVLFVIGYLVVAAILGVSVLTVIGPLIIGGPLWFGYFRVVQTRLKGEPASIGDVFQGFRDFGKGFLTFLLLALIVLGVVVVQMLLSLIPVLGILLTLCVSLVVGPMFFFVMPIAALSDVSPTDAISRSVKFCFANFWKMVLLSLVLGLIAMAGSLVCGIGALFTVPLAIVATVAAYNEYYLPKTQDAV
ncbi:MAG: hypothetical protein AMS14_06350 [Planctomycetes bacterium DG_20]|nr:MAG: hypothetical protein AMS14_06350 [Planctomycetes bacterium DG_20]